MERTLAIIKPDAMESGHEVKILTRIEDEGLVILDSRVIHLDKVFLLFTSNTYIHTALINRFQQKNFMKNIKNDLSIKT